MALGPMSTPRRSCPRSSGTPRTPTGRRPLPNVLSSKGHAAGAARVGGGLEEALRSAAHGVDPAEEHGGLIVGEYALIEGEIRLAGTDLVGKEVTLGVQARSADGGFQREPVVHYVHEDLHYGRRDAGGAGRS